MDSEELRCDVSNWKNDTKERERGVASSSTGLYS